MHSRLAAPESTRSSNNRAATTSKHTQSGPQRRLLGGSNAARRWVRRHAADCPALRRGPRAVARSGAEGVGDRRRGTEGGAHTCAVSSERKLIKEVPQRPKLGLFRDSY
jgi:hypothetical protein